MTKQILSVVLVLLLGYGMIEAWPLLSGPSLSVVAPTEDASAPGGTVTLTGSTARAVTLTVNGSPLIATEDGAFNTVRTYPHGVSLLTFVATDRFGRSRTITRQIFVPYSQ